MGIVVKEFIENKIKNNDLYEIKTTEKFDIVNLIMIVNKSSYPTYATSQLINLIANNI